MSTKNQTLEEFVLESFEELSLEHEQYGYIARWDKENPYWHFFLMSEDSKGKKYCAGDYPLKITTMDDILKVFSIYSNQGKKIIVNTDGYFTE